jgi:hypothetical protein
MQVGVFSDLREPGQCWGSQDLSGGLVGEGRACFVSLCSRVRDAVLNAISSLGEHKIEDSENETPTIAGCND